MTASSKKIRIAVSSCLLGNKVRFDGGHKHNHFVTQALGQHFELVAICPETAIGLPVPRPAIRLVGDAHQPRAVGTHIKELDVSTQLRTFGRDTIRQLDDISGYVFKKGSPSCGLERVKLYSASGEVVGISRGLYAQTIIDHNPLLPCEEEGRLMDPGLRESFIERVLIYHEWRHLLDTGLTAAKLIAFHSRHKFTLLAHDETIYRRCGRLIAGIDTDSVIAVSDDYIKLLLEGLRRPATRARHSNVLLHLLGYFKQRIDRDDKAELIKRINDYRAGHIPLLVPLALLQHHSRRHHNPYVAQQSYLQQYPEALGLRTGS